MSKKESFEEFLRRLHCAHTSFDELAELYYDIKDFACPFCTWEDGKVVHKCTWHDDETWEIGEEDEKL
jgi:hypothetical protein